METAPGCVTSRRDVKPVPLLRWGASRLFWPVTYAGDAEIFDIEVKENGTISTKLVVKSKG